MIINQLTVLKYMGWSACLGVTLLTVLKLLFKHPIPNASIGVCILVSLLALLKAYAPPS